jgi:hypothetical protein
MATKKPPLLVNEALRPESDLSQVLAHGPALRMAYGRYLGADNDDRHYESKPRSIGYHCGDLGCWHGRVSFLDKVIDPFLRVRWIHEGILGLAVRPPAGNFS